MTEDFIMYVSDIPYAMPVNVAGTGIFDRDQKE
jgi:hypothetical protein